MLKEDHAEKEIKLSEETLEEEREVKEELEVEAEEVAVVKKAEDIFSPLEEDVEEEVVGVEKLDTEEVDKDMEEEAVEGDAAEAEEAKGIRRAEEVEETDEELVILKKITEDDNEVAKGIRIVEGIDTEEAKYDF